MTNLSKMAEIPDFESSRHHISLIHKSLTMPNDNDVFRKESIHIFIHIILGISFLTTVAAVVLALADEDTALVMMAVLFAGIISAHGHAAIHRYHKELELSRHITMVPVAIYGLCFLLLTTGLTFGHSAYLGDGPLRSRLRPERRQKKLVMHEFIEPVVIGATEIKIASANLVTRSGRGQELKIVVAVNNISRTTKINNLSMISSKVLLKDDLDNYYAKVDDEPVKIEAKERNTRQGSLYPGERILLTYFFEPPIEGSEDLEFSITISPSITNQNLGFKIPKKAWMTQ